METEPNFLDLQCPYCGEKVSFPEDIELRVQECPNCLASMVISSEASPTAEKVPLPIVTPRLVLRRLERGDWKDLLECFSDEQLFEYARSGATTQEQVVEWIEKDSFTRLTVPNAWFCLALQHRQKEKVIGDVQWYLAEDHSQAAFEVYVHRGFQRKGLGTEALVAALRFCFVVLGFRRAVAHCDTRNTAAWRMCEKAGMRREGEFRKDTFFNGEWVDTFLYAMLTEEFSDAED